MEPRQRLYNSFSHNLLHRAGSHTLVVGKRLCGKTTFTKALAANIAEFTYCNSKEEFFEIINTKILSHSTRLEFLVLDSVSVFKDSQLLLNYLLLNGKSMGITLIFNLQSKDQLTPEQISLIPYQVSPSANQEDPFSFDVCDSTESFHWYGGFTRHLLALNETVAVAEPAEVMDQVPSQNLQAERRVGQIVSCLFVRSKL